MVYTESLLYMHHSALSLIINVLIVICYNTNFTKYVHITNIFKLVLLYELLIHFFRLKVLITITSIPHDDTL